MAHTQLFRWPTCGPRLMVHFQIFGWPHTDSLEWPPSVLLYVLVLPNLQNTFPFWGVIPMRAYRYMVTVVICIWLAVYGYSGVIGIWLHEWHISGYGRNMYAATAIWLQVVTGIWLEKLKKCKQIERSSKIKKSKLKKNNNSVCVLRFAMCESVITV